MKRRDMILATSGLAAGLALGCSDGTEDSGGAQQGAGGTGTGGAGTGGVGTGGAGTGGVGTGGTGTGGVGTGGTGTGGVGTGGGATGGSGGGSTGCATVTATDTNTFHQHELTVPPADVAAGVDKPYTVSPGGIGDHTHMITITAAQFATLASAGSVDVETTADSTTHTHVYHIVCG